MKTEQKINKAEQYVKLVEYLNEHQLFKSLLTMWKPMILSLLLNGHDKYRDYHKYIISSDRDFFQLVGERSVLYRPIQKKLVDKRISWLNMVFIPIILPLLEPLQEISQITYQAYLVLGLKQLKVVFLLWLTKRFKLLKRLQNIAEKWTNRLASHKHT
jgi:hypothetical protein